MRVHHKVIAAGAGLALALAGCGNDDGGGGGTSDRALAPGEFADAACLALEDEIGELAEQLPQLLTIAFGALGNPDGGGDFSETASQLKDLTTDLLDTLESAVDDLGAVGYPDVEGGQEQYQTAIEDAKAQITEAKSQLDDFDPSSVSSPDELNTAFEGLGGDLDVLDFDTVFESPELETAFDESETCQELESRFEDMGGGLFGDDSSGDDGGTDIGEAPPEGEGDGEG